MLEPQVVVNLSPELRVGADVMKHGSWFVKHSREWLARVGAAATRQQPGEHARRGEPFQCAVCATLGYVDHFVVLALQQHG
jgi:hypothetical protein